METKTRILELIKEHRLNQDEVQGGVLNLIENLVASTHHDEFLNNFVTIHEEQDEVIRIFFRDMVEWVNEGIFCVNAEGKILFANDRFCKNMEYERDEVIGTLIYDYFFDEETIRLSKSKMELRKRGVTDTYDIKMKRKSGDIIWVRVSGRPIFNEEGEFVGSLAIHSDITKNRKLEEDLLHAKEDLESKVAARTRELSFTNYQLSQQIKEKKITEVALKNSEKRFRDIFLNSPDAIYVEDENGVILDVNEETLRLHGYGTDELVGKTIFHITPTREHQNIRDRQPLIMAGSLSAFESECLTKDGRIIPIEVKAAVVDFKDRPALLMHVRDISERKRNEDLLQRVNIELEEKVKERTHELELANRALQKEIADREKAEMETMKQKNFLRMVIDSCPNLIFLKDAEGKFLLVNEAVARFYGLTHDQMEGHYNAKFNSEEGELSDFIEQDRQVLETGKQITFPEVAFRHRITNEIVWLHSTKKPIPSDDGKTMNVLAVSTDITDLRRAKEEIRLSGKLYRQIARNIPKSGIFIFDKNMRYLVAEGPLVGVISKPKEEIEGRTIYECIRKEDVTFIENQYREILSGKETIFQYELRGKHMLVNNHPVRDDNGEIIYGMVITLDITDLKHTQAALEERANELERSNEELERFAYVASHDLQGPLRTIASYLQLLEMRYAGQLDGQAREFIEFSVNGAKRMQQLILDLLNYSRINSMQRPFQMIDMNELVDGVLKNLGSAVTEANAVVSYEPLPRIVAEPGQLMQLFQNLIDNALKFRATDRQPNVRISFIEHEYEWEFVVSDNGIGIREEFREKIFQIFQRLHSSDEYPGTGVGLAICKKIVQLHGGKVWFESVPGQGTAFHFSVNKGLKRE